MSPSRLHALEVVPDWPLAVLGLAKSAPAEMSAAVTALRSTDVYGDIGSADYLADLGQFDEALALLEQAYEARHPYIPWINALAHYERLRSGLTFPGPVAPV